MSVGQLRCIRFSSTSPMNVSTASDRRGHSGVRISLMAVSVADLQAFAEAWNRHDIDALMGFMTEDCKFQASAGTEACGALHVGRPAVQAAFAEVWATYPDARWNSPRHFVCGDRGVSEWTFTGTRA